MSDHDLTPEERALHLHQDDCECGRHSDRQGLVDKANCRDCLTTEIRAAADAAAAREREPMECGHPRACLELVNVSTEESPDGLRSQCLACAREQRAVEEAKRAPAISLRFGGVWDCPLCHTRIPAELGGEIIGHQAGHFDERIELIAEAEARVRRECAEIAHEWAKNPLNDKSPATVVLRDFAFTIEPQEADRDE